MKTLSKLAAQNVYEIVKQNNYIIDSQLFKIEEGSLNMITDKVLFNEVKKGKSNTDYMTLQMDNRLTSIIGNYLPQDTDYYSANIITSHYTYGKSNLYIPYKNFNKTDIYNKTMKSNGAIQWIPTYDFIKMFGMDYLDNVNFDFKYTFSAVRMLNCSYIENGKSMSLDKSIERPILIVNFKEDLYRKAFKNIPIKGAYYFVADQNMGIISHSDINKVATYEKSNWLKELINKGSGSSIVNIDGKNMIVCYDTSDVTAWISVVIIPPDRLISSIVSVIKSDIFKLTLVLVLISLIFAYIISGSITKPLKRLLGAIKKTGEGNFDTKIQVNSGDGGEIGYLINKFNNMNDKIQILIEENYMTKIREKETEIMALNIQLNPHFLYNSLNIINWMAIDNKQKEISMLIVSLSSMLQYTAHNNSEMENFEDDLKWLKNYIYIMTHRFEGKFTVNYDIDIKLLEYKVPKLFLQPFVENSIIHGFESIDSGGIIKISGFIEENKIVFCVEDNGMGMDGKKMHNVMKNDNQSIGIKNVDRRIKLIFGDDYGVTIESSFDIGTKVIVVLPKLN